MRSLSGAAVVAIVLLLVYWTLAFLFQRSVMWPGPGFVPPGGLPAGTRQTWLAVSGGRVEAWLLPAVAPEHTPEGPLLIFAHGNAESIDLWPDQFGALRERGVSVLLVEYPGYGRSSGRPSRATVGEAMTAAHDWATGTLGVSGERIVAYGRSIGSGAACLLAGERQVAAIVLESGFADVGRLALRMGLPPFLVRDRFDNRAMLGRYPGPVLLIHGNDDAIIPVEHSLELHDVAENSTLELLPCGHNDCPRPWPQVLKFFELHSLLD